MVFDETSVETKRYLSSTSLTTHHSHRFASLFDFLARLLPFHLIVFLIKFAARSKYSRKINSQQFLKRANKFFGSQQFFQVTKCLKVAMWLIGDDLPSTYRRLVLSEFLKFIDEPGLHKKVSDSLTIATQSLASQPHPITPDTWFFLSRFFGSFAFMNAAFVARERSVYLRKLVSIDERSSRRQLETLCAALLESLALKEVNLVLNKFGQRFRPDKYLHFNLHLDLLTGNRLSSETDVDNLILGSESNIRDLIRGKRVSLVGPGFPIADFGQEIDQADLVFRIKFPGRRYLLENQNYGVRCDIAEFTNVTSMELLIKDGVRLDFFDGLKAVVVLNRTNSKSIQGVPIYHFDNFNTTYQLSDLTTGVRCLVNLLLLEPASVKLFGFDFYAGKEMYDFERVKFYQEYGWAMGNPIWSSKDRSKSFSDRVRSFLLHDQIANFVLARNLYLVGRFEIEPFGASILSLDPSEYANRIECVMRETLRKNVD